MQIRNAQVVTPQKVLPRSPQQNIMHFRPPSHEELEAECRLLPVYQQTEHYFYNGHDVTEYFVGDLTYSMLLEWDVVDLTWRFPAAIEYKRGVVDLKTCKFVVHPVSECRLIGCVPAIEDARSPSPESSSGPVTPENSPTMTLSTKRQHWIEATSYGLLPPQFQADEVSARSLYSMRRGLKIVLIIGTTNPRKASKNIERIFRCYSKPFYT
ncbi:hypothetical protein EIP86_006196 [Pleurotus ostreatoroseus]|nr:hypothetical protein EIP86_006196 [Pleurotus ostreatoroseus]